MRMPVLIVACLILLPFVPAHAKEPWADEPAFKSLVKQETKTLRGLLTTALKKDYRRQAWYLADRLVQLDPTDDKATDVLDRWDGQELTMGQVPNKGWVKKRDGTLRKLGDAYFHFGEVLEASGMDPLKYYPINIRAHAYGSQAGNLLTALDQAGYVWLGVYGAKPRKEVDTLLGEAWSSFTFPQEYEDKYLEARAVWPEANGARWGQWLLLTDHGYKEALRLLGMLRAAETWMVDTFGSKAKKNDKTVTRLLVFSEWQAYDKIGRPLLEGRKRLDPADFDGTSGWHDRRYDRLMVCWRHRDNPYLGDDDLMLGHAAKVMARRHLAGGAGGSVQGKGYWLLEGLRGAFEGFRLDQDGNGEIDPGSCWRLAVARVLRDQGLLIPWDEFMELSELQGKKLDRPTIKIKFGGTERDAKNVDIVAAQATALVVGILKTDGGKKRKRFAKLVGDLLKRDSLPDIDKTLGLKKGKAVAMAEVAMDAAHGLENK
ncbi:MAG: hypothetical protein QNJ90_13355 [Planctomycetota bacterium]|nr:hypothetical protein [Planctomycetota bacterium]